MTSEATACGAQPLCNCAGNTVNCSGKQLSRVPTGIPVGTTTLVLENNNIRSINASDVRDRLHLPQLTSLNLASNQLEYLPVNFLGLIRTGNNVTAAAEPVIDDHQSKITHLFLGSNKLVELPTGLCRHAKHLGVLHANSNGIHTIADYQLKKCKELTNLDLSNNDLAQISSFALDGLTKMVTLALSDNNIQVIQPWAFSALYNLEELDLANNAIKSLDDSVFDSNYKLLRLFMMGNKIKFLHRKTWGFLNLIRDQLEIVDFDGNPALDQNDVECSQCDSHAMTLAFKDANLIRYTKEVCVKEKLLDRCVSPVYGTCHKESGSCVSQHDFQLTRPLYSPPFQFIGIRFGYKLVDDSKLLITPRTEDNHKDFIQRSENEVVNMFGTCGHAVEPGQHIRLLTFKECGEISPCYGFNNSEAIQFSNYTSTILEEFVPLNTTTGATEGLQLEWIVDGKDSRRANLLTNCIVEQWQTNATSAALGSSAISFLNLAIPPFIQIDTYSKLPNVFDPSNGDSVVAEKYTTGYYVVLVVIILASLILLAGLYSARHQARLGLKKVHSVASQALIRVQSMSPRRKSSRRGNLSTVPSWRKSQKSLKAEPSYYGIIRETPSLQTMVFPDKEDEERGDLTDQFIRRYMKEKFRAGREAKKRTVRSLRRVLSRSPTRSRRHFASPGGEQDQHGIGAASGHPVPPPRTEPPAHLTRMATNRTRRSVGMPEAA